LSNGDQNSDQLLKVTTEMSSERKVCAAHKLSIIYPQKSIRKLFKKKCNKSVVRASIVTEATNKFRFFF
jgi:hypothetical protein